MIFLRRSECALILVSLVLLTISCRSKNNSVANENSTTNTVVSSTPPFQTKEPDRYLAVRTITITAANSQTSTTRSLTARDGDRRRNESQISSKTIAYLEGPEGRFVLMADEKIYAEIATGTDLPSNDGDEGLQSSPEGLLHADTGSTSYQKLGQEVIAARTTDKYRVVVNDANAGNVSVSETLIWIDQALKMPVKSETKSADGTRVSMELSDISLEVDANLFKIPDDYRKVSFAEFRQGIVHKTTPDSGRGIN
jgi:outer membrane lipoprotein-sorting protein